MPEETYTLLLELDEGDEIEVGALGTRTFKPGGYAYIDSAFGSGVFESTILRGRTQVPAPLGIGQVLIEEFSVSSQFTYSLVN